MSGNPLLDGTLLAVSFFNTIVALWLGLLILLSAERRSWGVWLTAGGLLAGSAFFICHTAILEQEISFFTTGLSFWWHAAWFPLILAPVAWYIGVLWYAGYWDEQKSLLHRRHRTWLTATLLLTLGLSLVLILWAPLPKSSGSYLLAEGIGPIFLGIPVLFIIYPVFIILCIVASMDALLRPGPTRRWMGDEARQRARPWLIGVSLLLLIVSLTVSVFIGWLLTFDELRLGLPALVARISTPLAWIDLVMQGLIGGAILMVGQAVVAYEIFTGRRIPRRTLRLEWKRVLGIAVAVSLLAAWTLTIHLQPIYSLLLIIILLVCALNFLTSWSAREREALMRQMRPLMASQQMVPSLLDSENPLDFRDPFFALCRDFLGVERACLIPVGPISSLGCETLGYPAESVCPQADLETLLNQIPAQKSDVLSLNRLVWNGMLWAIPLWNVRGLIGLLFLGRKKDDSLLNQEEIEISRLEAERLLDLQASVILSAKLMEIQRQRITESQILDRQTRRVIHDEILPRIHASLLSLSSASSPDSQAVTENLSEAHRQLSRLLHDLPPSADPQVQRLGLVGAIRDYVNQEASRFFSAVSWEIQPLAEEFASRLPQLEAEVVYYAAREGIRNAARHGSSSGQQPVSLWIRMRTENDLVLEIEDNGVGFNPASGEGNPSRQGLAIHSAMLALIGGTMEIESRPGNFTRVTLRFPVKSSNSADQPADRVKNPD